LIRRDTHEVMWIFILPMRWHCPIHLNLRMWTIYSVFLSFALISDFRNAGQAASDDRSKWGIRPQISFRTTFELIWPTNWPDVDSIYEVRNNFSSPINPRDSGQYCAPACVSRNLHLHPLVDEIRVGHFEFENACRIDHFDASINYTIIWEKVLRMQNK
jgi:hypothetical protein